MPTGREVPHYTASHPIRPQFLYKIQLYIVPMDSEVFPKSWGEHHYTFCFPSLVSSAKATSGKPKLITKNSESMRNIPQHCYLHQALSSVSLLHDNQRQEHRNHQSKPDTVPDYDVCQLKSDTGSVCSLNLGHATT